MSAALRPHKARPAILLQCGMSGALRPQGPPISQGPPHGVSKRPVASASLLALNSVAPAALTLPPPARDNTCCCRALQTAVAFARHAQSRRRRHSTRGGLRRALSSWRSTRTPLAVTLHVVGRMYHPSAGPPSEDQRRELAPRRPCLRACRQGLVAIPPALSRGELGEGPLSAAYCGGTRIRSSRQPPPLRPSADAGWSGVCGARPTQTRPAVQIAYEWRARAASTKSAARLGSLLATPPASVSGRVGDAH